MASSVDMTDLTAGLESSCRVECVVMDDAEDVEDVLFINSGHSSASCQTDVTFFDACCPSIPGVPIFYCGQPSPGTLTTQCFIPWVVDVGVGTDPPNTCSSHGWRRNHTPSKPTAQDPCLKQTSYSLTKEAEDVQTTCKGTTTTTKVKTEDASCTSPGFQPAQADTEPVQGHRKRGRKRKVLQDAGDADSTRHCQSSTPPTTIHKITGKRRRRKKRDDNFEYDLGDSEEDTAVKLETCDEDDDADKDWTIERDDLSSGGGGGGGGGDNGDSDDNDGYVNNRKRRRVSWKDSREVTSISPLLDLKDECEGDEVDYKSLIEEVTEECGDSSDEEDRNASAGSKDDLFHVSDGKFTNRKNNRILTIGINDLDSETYISKQSKKYSERAKEKYHQEKVLKDNGKFMYKCLKCNEEFEMRLQLKEHRKVHTAKVRMYECGHCDKVFTEARKYYSHLGFHDRLFECRSCGRRFSLLGNLKKHLSIHQGAPDQVCEVCGNQFLTLDELELHRQTQHLDDSVRTYKMECEHCGKKYVREEAYNQHMNRAPYKCSMCDVSVGCESKLKTHIRNQHGRCVCEFCGKSFKKNSLIHHIKIVHKEACIQCPQCPKKFTYRSKMLAHLDANHTQEKKYKCNLCKYSARTVNTLNLHRRKHHMDPSLMPQYPCKVCGRKFYLPSKLTLHYRVHTGEKPFKCHTCGKAFATKYNMVEHERCVHGERVQLRHPDGTTFIRVIKHRRAPRAPGRRCELCGLDLPSSWAMLTHMKEEHHAQPLPNTSTEPDTDGGAVEVHEDMGEDLDKFEVSKDQCEEVMGSGDQDLILADSSGIVSIPEYATHVEIDGVEYQVLRQ